MIIVAGAYPAAPRTTPWDPAEEASFLRQVLDHDGIDGLELAYADALHGHDEPWLLELLPAASTHVVTAVPGTAVRARTDPAFGLASADRSGRDAAVRMVAGVRDAVERVVQAAGRPAVHAVELQTAPGRTADRAAAGTAEALAESLRELAGWDWCGASLTIEHCDALRDDHQPEKGFLALHDEIAAIRAAGVGVGLVVNWARSVIEGRAAGAAVAHVTEAREAGLLRGVIFSGVAGTGEGAWADAHLPPLPGHPESLLTPTEVARTLGAVDGASLGFLGAKVVARPTDRTPRDRADGVCAAVDVVRAAYREAPIPRN